MQQFFLHSVNHFSFKFHSKIVSFVFSSITLNFDYSSAIIWPFFIQMSSRIVNFAFSTQNATSSNFVHFSSRTNLSCPSPTCVQCGVRGPTVPWLQAQQAAQPLRVEMTQGQTEAGGRPRNWLHVASAQIWRTGRWQCPSCPGSEYHDVTALLPVPSNQSMSVTFWFKKSLLSVLFYFIFYFITNVTKMLLNNYSVTLAKINKNKWRMLPVEVTSCGYSLSNSPTPNLYCSHWW